MLQADPLAGFQAAVSYTTSSLAATVTALRGDVGAVRSAGALLRAECAAASNRVDELEAALAAATAERDAAVLREDAAHAAPHSRLR